MNDTKYVCIHGHFYQPPRENPWLEAIELQDSARPFHDWNERISYECYAPNTASRILAEDGDITDITNNYSKISFNFGPTLLSWLEKYEPEVYKAILKADEESQKNFSGHGSAMAQAFGHIIMPLANLRDKHTQVVWGIRDFEYRFKRKPEGMWLPEAAVDTESLEVLAEHGIKFTLLAPRQARRVRKIGQSQWIDVSGDRVDPKMPYICRLPSGKSIVLFFYDGPISQDVAFKGILKNGRDFANRFLDSFTYESNYQPQLVHIATDGESYGHHHRHGDMALAYCIHYLESRGLARITNYGEYLSKFPPTYEAEIFENSSWSCVHGVERWRNDCGCNTGGRPGWNQLWRDPLRKALDWLRDELVKVYEKEAGPLLRKPWQARNAYMDILLQRSKNRMEGFIKTHASRELSKEEKIKVIKLLEMQRHAMLMYTSCGWFFDEISGIETIQVIQYASRAIQLAEEVTLKKLEKEFITRLEKAPSNQPEYGNAAQIYEVFVKPARLDLLKVGVHYAITSLFEDYPDNLPIYSYIFKSEVYDRLEAGIQKLVIGIAKVHSTITWEESEVSFVVLYLGQHTVIANAMENMPDELFAAMHSKIRKAFLRSEVAEIIHLMEGYFGPQRYSLFHLSKDEQRRVLNQIMQTTLQEIENSFRQIYEHNYHMMNLMNNAQAPLPSVFKTTVEFILNADIRRLFEDEHVNLDDLQRLTEEVERWSVKLDPDRVGYVITKKMNVLMNQLLINPRNTERLRYILEIFKQLKKLPLNFDIWMIQNLYFSVGDKYLKEMQKAANLGDASSSKWLTFFSELGNELEIKASRLI
jgi:alpha-amylase/alpha-mannosidase (GH57 family)